MEANQAIRYLIELNQNYVNKFGITKRSQTMDEVINTLIRYLKSYEKKGREYSKLRKLLLMNNVMNPNEIDLLDTDTVETLYWTLLYTKKRYSIRLICQMLYEVDVDLTNFKNTYRTAEIAKDLESTEFKYLRAYSETLLEYIKHEEPKVYEMAELNIPYDKAVEEYKKYYAKNAKIDEEWDRKYRNNTDIHLPRVIFLNKQA